MMPSPCVPAASSGPSRLGPWTSGSEARPRGQPARGGAPDDREATLAEARQEVQEGLKHALKQRDDHIRLLQATVDAGKEARQEQARQLDAAEKTRRELAEQLDAAEKTRRELAEELEKRGFEVVALRADVVALKEDGARLRSDHQLALDRMAEEHRLNRLADDPFRTAYRRRLKLVQTLESRSKGVQVMTSDFKDTASAPSEATEARKVQRPPSAPSAQSSRGSPAPPRREPPPRPQARRAATPAPRSGRSRSARRTRAII